MQTKTKGNTLIIVLVVAVIALLALIIAYKVGQKSIVGNKLTGNTADQSQTATAKGEIPKDSIFKNAEVLDVSAENVLLVRSETGHIKVLKLSADTVLVDKSKEGTEGKMTLADLGKLVKPQDKTVAPSAVIMDIVFKKEIGRDVEEVNAGDITSITITSIVKGIASQPQSPANNQ